MFRFEAKVVLLNDNSSLRMVDWHISKNFRILFTLYDVSIVGEIVAFVSQYPNNSMGSVIL